ncbi:hypothetical protein FAGKG844_960003 [Frankia sp. AgKG'84/4]
MRGGVVATAIGVGPIETSIAHH